MTATARKVGTYADLEALPPHLVGELIFGVVHASPRPAALHANAAVGLTEELSGPFRRGKGGPGGWVILLEPEVHLEGDVLVPDLAAWRRSRMPELLPTAFISLAPDWVCEVLSPSTQAIDRGDKSRVYAREKVTHIWFVDPIVKTLEILRLDGGTYRVIDVFAGDTRVRAEPFDAVELDLAALWMR
jgi:Uma2 family endonuclease